MAKGDKETASAIVSRFVESSHRVTTIGGKDERYIV